MFGGLFMDRRDFLKACSTVAVASMIDPSVFSNMLSAQEGMFKAYKKALLVKEDGSPLREEDLKPHNAYIFFYPIRKHALLFDRPWGRGKTGGC
jgi:arsenite oxidase small subunit